MAESGSSGNSQLGSSISSMIGSIVGQVWDISEDVKSREAAETANQENKFLNMKELQMKGQELSDQEATTAFQKREVAIKNLNGILEKQPDLQKSLVSMWSGKA